MYILSVPVLYDHPIYAYIIIPATPKFSDFSNKVLYFYHSSYTSVSTHRAWFQQPHYKSKENIAELLTKPFLRPFGTVCFRSI
jgi:hypothetical protein